jgi:hypothetical protein
VPNALGLLDFDWDAPLPGEERDRLLRAAAGAVRRRRLEVPCALFLETVAPLSRMAGQGLVAFSPFLAPLLPGGLGGVQRLHKLLERPENVRRLIDLLAGDDAGADAARE